MDSVEIRTCLGYKACTCGCPCVHCTCRRAHLLTGEYESWCHQRTKKSIEAARQTDDEAVATAVGVHRRGGVDGVPDMYPDPPLCPVRMFFPEAMHCHIVGNTERRVVAFCAMLTKGALVGLNQHIHDLPLGVFALHWDKLPVLELQNNSDGLLNCNMQELQRYFQVLHMMVAPWLTIDKIKPIWVKWLTRDERLSEVDIVPLVVNMLGSQGVVNRLVFTHCHLGDGDGELAKKKLTAAVGVSKGIVQKLFGHFLENGSNPKGSRNFSVLNEHQQVLIRCLPQCPNLLCLFFSSSDSRGGPDSGHWWNKERR